MTDPAVPDDTAHTAALNDDRFRRALVDSVRPAQPHAAGPL
jgi:hypothetical protein